MASFLPPGTRLGSFEVLSLLGSGGMGEVYRARDSVLKRDVALKVLPAAFAEDAERVARFTREAEVLASLNHPHIAQIYGVADGEGVHAIVMELVEGEDLSRRLARGAIPIEQALPIARQIAEALEGAHEHGVVHRDLKTANVVIRADGTVKVLDFGLAKPAAPTAESLANSPTVTAQAPTGAGVILGTAAYMSPEQARGKPVDRRGDIWAFGCVLFEMLTATPAFTGETVTDVLAAVVDKEPAWSGLPAATPASVTRLLRRCLAKDLALRLPHIGAARLELLDAIAPSSPADSTPSPHVNAARWRLVAIGVGVTALAVIAVLGAYAASRSERSAPRAAQRFDVLLPPDIRLTEVAPIQAIGHAVALSPDDQTIVFLGTRDAVTQLYVRRVDQYDVRTLRGTEGASVPFFSPDGTWVGFQLAGQLQRVSLASDGAPPIVICSLPGEITSASWGQDGSIVFASRDGLGLVAASGGRAEALTTLQPGEVTHDFPQVLSGGRVLFTVTTATPGQPPSYQATLLSRVTGERRVVQDDGQSAVALFGSHLMFLRAANLWTVPFDEALGVVTGTPVPAITDVFVRGNIGTRSFAVSARSLLYVPGGLDGTINWVERNGLTSPILSERGSYEHPMLSPDGTRVVFDAGLPGRKDLWVYDLARGTKSRLTTSEGIDAFAIWTPDGTAVSYVCNSDICRTPINGTGAPETLVDREYNQSGTSWSPDGRTLVYMEPHPKTGRDIWAVTPGREPTPVLVTPFNESGAVFSPDGRYLAYISDESGRSEIYVRSFQTAARKWPISSSGGAEPAWSTDGTELFYREGDTMMAVPVTLQPTFTAGVPRRLFEGRFDSSGTHQHYGVGGGRFLMVQRDQDVGPSRLHMILNFDEELKARVPAR